MELICDKRETKVFGFAKDHSVVKSEFLTIGDFLLGMRNDDRVFIPLVVVERKTWADLSASIKDGRIKNIQKLRSFREETGAKIAYLLEGSAPKNPCSLVEGIPYKNLRAHLDHLLFRDGIIELHSSGPADSLNRLLEFLGNLKKYGEEKKTQSNQKDGLVAAQVKVVLSDDQIKDKMWASFEGISLASAPAFRHLSIRELFIGEIKEDDLAQVQVGAKKFGPKRAASIVSSVSKEITLDKLLCSLPQISSKRARLIIDCLSEGIEPLPIRNLFTDWSNLRAKIEKKVGKKCCEVIEKFLL